MGPNNQRPAAGGALSALLNVHDRSAAGPYPASGISHPSARPPIGFHHDLGDDLRCQWLAYGQKYDIQTGLMNPKFFQESLDQLVSSQKPGDEGVALVWIDLLNMRKEFTVWGWTGTDALVRHVAGTVRSITDQDALFSQFGRCFVVCIPASKSDQVARRRIQTLVDEIARPVPGFNIVPELAAGVAFFPGDADCADDLARYASLAADVAATKQIRAVLPFQPGMNNRMMRDREMELEIDNALTLDHLNMFYQPKFDLLTGDLLGAEALMRWKHQRWGDVPASEFIPVAERTQLIDRVFDFSLRTALRDALVWKDLGIAPPIISVNISPANLRREDFARRVRRILEEFPIDPIELELEVTESLLLDDQRLFTARVRQLKSIGVRVAIDDFGTRYTGFDLLKKLPLDAMKIDRCFIRGIHRSADLRALSTTIVAMARHMKMRTVAEGIEVPEELEVLQKMGCDAGQGFLIQRPICSDEFTAFLRSWPLRKLSFGFRHAAQLPAVDALFGTS